ncbi:MAG: cell division protein ZipA, partial [Woeseiaceae bacterium]
PTLQREQVASEPDSSDALLSEPSIDIEPQKIVTLRVVAREKKAFNGEDLVLSMRGIGLRHGKFGIFHRYDGNDETRTIFSAASLVEPGSFDLANIKDQEIPGISLFLVLPGPVDGAESFDLMMAAARALSQSLNGELLDESGSTLSIQRERYLREEIIQFQHSILVA